MGMDALIRRIMRLSQPHLTKFSRNQKLFDSWKMDPHLRNIAPKLIIPARLLKHRDEAVAQEKQRFDMRRPYRILSLDGGGVRGILTATILERIVEHDPNFMDQVDFICGTSVGGIMALILAAGYSPKEAREIYTHAIPYIFAYNPWRTVNPFGAKYDDTPKMEIFQHFFGDSTLGDLQKTVAVIAFRLDGQESQSQTFFSNKGGWRPAVFSNMPRSEGLVEPDNNLKIWQAAMRTSAAPTYFPIVDGYTDGAISANNPSIIAVSKTMVHFPHVNMRNLVVLSLGAGSYPRRIDFSQTIPNEWTAPLYRNWGIKQWIPHLLDMLLDGDSVTNEMIMHNLLGPTGMYHRFDPKLPRQMALDDVSCMDELKQFGRDIDISSTLKFIDDNFCYDDLNHVDDNMGYNSLDAATNYHDAWEDMVERRQQQSGRGLSKPIPVSTKLKIEKEYSI